MLAHQQLSLCAKEIINEKRCEFKPSLTKCKSYNCFRTLESFQACLILPPCFCCPSFIPNLNFCYASNRFHNPPPHPQTQIPSGTYFIESAHLTLPVSKMLVPTQFTFVSCPFLLPFSLEKKNLISLLAQGTLHRTVCLQVLITALHFTSPSVHIVSCNGISCGLFIVIERWGKHK